MVTRHPTTARLPLYVECAVCSLKNSPTRRGISYLRIYVVVLVLLVGDTLSATLKENIQFFVLLTAKGIRTLMVHGQRYRAVYDRLFRRLLNQYPLFIQEESWFTALLQLVGRHLVDRRTGQISRKIVLHPWHECH